VQKLLLKLLAVLSAHSGAGTYCLFPIQPGISFWIMCMYDGVGYAKGGLREGGGLRSSAHVALFFRARALPDVSGTARHGHGTVHRTPVVRRSWSKRGLLADRQNFLGQSSKAAKSRGIPARQSGDSVRHSVSCFFCFMGILDGT
jgi:hypothetical protein